MINFSSKSGETVNEKPIKLTEKDDDHPVVYSKTKAYTHLARHTRYVEQNLPDWQPLAIWGSFSIFMIYFCVLREENDLDDILRRPLDDTIPGISKTVFKYER